MIDQASPNTTLVVSAWEPELAPLRRLLRGHHAGAVILAAAGVGAIDAAAGATRAITASGAQRVIFVGTAGSYARAAIGTAAVAGELSLVSTAVLRGDGYLPAPLIQRAAPDATLSARLQAATGLQALPVACPLAITGTAALARRIAAATGASLENLEAFAVARAAAADGIDFAAVLGIANRVGPQAHQEWRDHHVTASRAACRAVWAYLRGAPDTAAKAR